MNSELRLELTAEGGPLAGAHIADVSPVGGGCIHQAWKLLLSNGQVLFAKSGGLSALPLFEVEMEALEALHAHSDNTFLVVPQPLALAALPHGAVLLLPWLDCRGSDQAALGRGWHCFTSRPWHPAQPVSAGTVMASSVLVPSQVVGGAIGDLHLWS